MVKFGSRVNCAAADMTLPDKKTARRWRDAAVAQYQATADSAAVATGPARRKLFRKAADATTAARAALVACDGPGTTGVEAAREWRDVALAQSRAVTDGTSGAAQQAQTRARRQAAAAVESAQTALDLARTRAGRQSAAAGQALGELREQAGPAVVGLAGQGRDYAVQVGSQAWEHLAPAAGALAQAAVRQRDDLAPTVEDWAGQARDRLTDLGAQARDEVAPAVAEFIGQTRGRVGQIGAQARDQLAPAAADLAGQARDRAVQLGSQTRNTAASLQASAGNLVPAVSDAAGETAAVVGDAFDATGRAVRSTTTDLFWLVLLGGIAVFLYAPKDEERAKLLAEAQGWLSYIVDIVTELRGGD